MKIKTTKDLPHVSGGVIPKGSTIEHKDAYWHVLMGQAEPADDECIERVKLYRGGKPAPDSNEPIITPPVQ